jgi:hypothetical protein
MKDRLTTESIPYHRRFASKIGSVGGILRVPATLMIAPSRPLPSPVA